MLCFMFCLKLATNQPSPDLYFIFYFNFLGSDSKGNSYFILVQKKQIDLCLRVFLQSYTSGGKKKSSFRNKYKMCSLLFWSIGVSELFILKLLHEWQSIWTNLLSAHEVWCPWGCSLGFLMLGRHSFTAKSCGASFRLHSIFLRGDPVRILQLPFGSR